MIAVNEELISDIVFSKTYIGDVSGNYIPNPKGLLSEYGVTHYKELMGTGVLYDSYFEQPSKGAVTVKIKRMLIPVSRSYFIGDDFQVVILNSKYTQFLFLFRKFILFFKTIFNVVKYRSVSKAFDEYNTLKNTMSGMDKHFWSQLSIILSLIIYQFFAYGLS